MSNTEVILYDWRPFFRTVAEELVKIGKDAGTRDEKIRDKATAVFGVDNGILKFDYIDPFSFIYTLSVQSKAAPDDAQRIENAMGDFGISAPITDWKFPHANAINSLFHSGGSFVAGNDAPSNEEQQKNLAEIWKLFTAVYEAKTYTAITDEQFRTVLQRPNFGLANVTQTMFLINPDVFLPIDGRTLYLPPLRGDSYATMQKLIKDGTRTFNQVMNIATAPFVKCNPYEINLFAWSLESKSVVLTGTVWSIGVYPGGIGGTDPQNCKDDFRNKHSVWIGGWWSDEELPGGFRNAARGDLLIAREGVRRAHMLGVILENKYTQFQTTDSHEWFGAGEQHGLSVLWIHADECTFNPREKGFIFGGGAMPPAFRSFEYKNMPVLYKDMTKMLDVILHINPLQQQIDLLHANHNLILTGAPGTGKTYMAKEIAQCFLKDKLGGNPCFGFVQFHPSYDYTDFVEGLRPIQEAGQNTIGFERKDGIFKKFCQEAKDDPDNKYVFVIDEINRGELSKIFGELFFSIDPGYRGEEGGVTTQYANMTEKKEEKFYVPENVYIIGTMNDIDRSVESMDFAMRRRFAWMEIKYDKTWDMLDILDTMNSDITAQQAKDCLKNLNQAIEKIDGLGTEFHVGASYFMKLQQIQEQDPNEDNAWDTLWECYLKPLLFEYVRALPDTKDDLEKLHDAYRTEV